MLNTPTSPNLSTERQAIGVESAICEIDVLLGTIGEDLVEVN